MSIFIIPVFLLPIVTLMILFDFKKRYNSAVDLAEKNRLKKKLTIAIVINIIVFIALAVLIGLFVYFLFALKNMT